MMQNCIECNDRFKCDYYMHDYVGCNDLYRRKKCCEKEKELAEVIHAKWIWKDFNYDGYYTLCCSECFSTDGARENANYCSECGAKMDL